MPQVSVIVPVYCVETYVSECLESVLSQDFKDLEVVAVNDASPDGSLEILRDYQCRDPRMVVVDLPSNVGLGGARNAGLDAAKGEFVLFLDSDDALNPKAISAAVERAQATGAEVLLFDWTRDYPDGRTIPGTGHKILADAPDRFTAAEYPRILQLLQLACNKLIRRDLLERLDLQFEDGAYEDTAFTYPLLLGARSLTTLPSYLLRYRQRDGAITHTAGDRHVEVLRQWDRAMKRALSLTSDRDEARSYLFVQMLKHGLLVLLEHRRIPKALQSDYVKELRRLCREYRPASGYPKMIRTQRLQHRLLELGSPALLKAHWAITHPAFLKGVRSGLLRKVRGDAMPQGLQQRPKAGHAS